MPDTQLIADGKDASYVDSGPVVPVDAHLDFGASGDATPAGSDGGSDGNITGSDARDANGDTGADSGSDVRDAAQDRAPETGDVLPGVVDTSDTQNQDGVDTQNQDGVDVPGPQIDASDTPGPDISDASAGSEPGLDLGPLTCPAPSYAQPYPVPSLAGLALDSVGNQYVAATIYGTNLNFAGVTVSSAGSADVLVAKLDPTTGLATWAKPFGGTASGESGGTSDQTANGLAVSQSSFVGVIGNFVGNLKVNGTTTLPGSTNPVDFIMGTDGSGAGQWGKPVDTQFGALTAIVSHPSRDEFVVCGYAAGGVTDLGLDGHYNGDGKEDILVAKLSASTGNVIWAHQIGDAGLQMCTAVTMDAAGTVYATGIYNGVLDLGLGAFPTLASSVLAIWVAKLDSDTGTALEAAHYGTLSKQGARAIAVDSSGAVAVAGNVKTSLSFGNDTLTSAGSTDGFVVKLSASLSPLWAKRWGDSDTQEAHGVAFNSTGDVFVVGYLQGSISELGGVTMTASGSSSDAYWAKFNGSDGTPTACAAYYGDAESQVADFVVISTTDGAQKDKVNVVGYSTGTIDFGGGVSLTSLVANGFLLQLTP